MWRDLLFSERGASLPSHFSVFVEQIRESFTGHRFAARIDEQLGYRHISSYSQPSAKIARRLLPQGQASLLSPFSRYGNTRFLGPRGKAIVQRDLEGCQPQTQQAQP